MKPIVQCPQCGQSYQAAPEWAGKTTNCPACGTLIQIPAAPQLTPVAYAPPVQPVKPRQAYVPPQPAYQQQPPAHVQHQAGNSTNPLVWAAIGGGVIAVFFVFTLFIYALGRSNGKSAVTAQAPAVEYSAPSSSSPAYNPPAPVAPQPQNSVPVSPRPVVMPRVEMPRTPVVSPSPAITPTTSASDPKPAVPDGPAPQPVTPVTPATPPVVAAPAPEFGSQILVDRWGRVIFGPPGCPVAITGSQVWDIATKKLRSELKGRKPPANTLAAISPDGNYFAALNMSDDKNTEVAVWDAKTGEQKFSLSGAKGSFMDKLYLSNSQVFLGSVFGDKFQVWDLETGFEGKTIEIPDARIERGSTGFTVDGSYVAMPVGGKVTVFKTATGKMAAYMGTPKAEGPRGMPASLSHLRSLRFSADNQELAGVTTHPKPRVLCWDNRGKLIFDEPYPLEVRGSGDNGLQWFPNRQAWLIEQDVFDRKAGKVVLTIRKPWAQDLHLQVHDDDHLIGTFPSNLEQVDLLEIPWEKIRASQAAMKSKEAAILTPSAPVSLLIQLGDLRGDQAEVKTLIETAFTERLQRDGFTLAAGGKSYFRIKFAEAAGDTLPIFERQRFQWGPGRDTGRTATESKGDLVVELFVFGRTDPIWRDTMKVTSSSSFNEEITDATIRKSMLDRAAMEIRRLNFPYFIPESEEMVALPIVVQ